MIQPPSSRRALWCSLVGAGAAIALTVFLRSVFGTRLLAEVLLDATTDGSSPENFSFLLKTLEELARPLLFVSVLLAQLAVYVSVWRRTEGIDGHVWGVPKRELTAALVAAGVFVAATVLIGVFFDAELGSSTSGTEYVLVTLFAAIVFALTSRALEMWDASISGAPADSSRRLFLGNGPAVAIGILAVYVVGTQVLNTRKGGTQQGAHPGKPTEEITANEDFYKVSKNLIDPPKVDIGEWRLRVSGQVVSEADFTIEELRAMPSVEQYATFQCISNEVGGYLMGTALWKGILLTDLLKLVQPLGSARNLWFESTDDYTENLPLSFAAMEGVMLAYDMNGVPLPQDHGFPLRLVAPGKYGMKQPKWILNIKVRSDAEDGYWTKRGWDTEADMQTSSRIDVPRDGERIEADSLRIEGVAFSGRRGIKKVEVSTDSGQSWQEATLKTPPLSEYTWVLWHFDWGSVPTSGVAKILARATDGRGDTQTTQRDFPFPKGATGYPQLDVRTGG